MYDVRNQRGRETLETLYGRRCARVQSRKVGVMDGDWQVT